MPAYVPQDWLNGQAGGTPVSSERLEHMEEGIAAARVEADDVTMAEGKNLVAGTTTGAKIGTGATQKLAFWGATPVVRPAANPDTSGATLANLEIEVNQLKALLRSVGLLA